MTLQEKIKELCNKQGIGVTRLEKILGFANGSLSRTESIKSDRLVLIADYFGVSIDDLLDRESDEKKYYLNDETSKIAQAIFENKEMRVLFDAAKDASPEDLSTVYSMLLALKRKENGE